MKKNVWTWMLAAGMVLVGCSDEMEGPDTPSIVDGANGYARVTINLPTTSGMGTRADSFDDGLNSEYAVKSGIIAYFSGASEADATFVGAYNLPVGEWNTVGMVTDAITSERAFTAQAPLLENTNKAYVLVILNPHSDVISLNNNTHALTINSTSYEASATTGTQLKLATLQAKLSDQDIADYTGDAGFTMLNAPLASKGVTSLDKTATISIMPTVTIYETQADAQANSATEIYMERIMAKVTLTGFDDELRKGIEVGADYEGYVVLNGWTLDVTNKSTKLVHDVTDATTETTGWFYLYANDQQTQNRFVASAAPYRIYWSVDGNYNGTNYGTANPDDPDDTRWTQEFNYIASQDADDITWTETIGDNSPLYCFENTFNVDNMDQSQTTRIVLTGKYHFTNKTTGQSNSDDPSGTLSFFVVESEEKTTTYTVEGFISKVNETVKDFLLEGWTPATTVNGGTYDSVDGLATLLDKNATTDATDLQTLLSAFGSVKYYKNGQVFYHISRIEHFGEALTPWSQGDDYTAAQHLGRYGVVRNNWYELNITKITGPGEPEIPGTPENPDDDETGYIQATIKILSWAKRTQNVEL